MIGDSDTILEESQQHRAALTDRNKRDRMTRSQDSPVRDVDSEADYDMFFLLKNLREKKAKGTLSDLDKKLLLKI